MREVIKLIERDGWRLDRQRDSHRIYRHESKQGIVVVAGARGKDVRAGEGIELYIESLREHGGPVPAPTQTAGVVATASL